MRPTARTAGAVPRSPWEKFDDLVQPIGEAEADSHQGAEEAEDEALHPYPERDREQREL